MTEIVKVYKVTAMAELEIEAAGRAAIEEAMERSKTEVGIWTQADCEMVAVLMVNHVEGEDDENSP